MKRLLIPYSIWVIVSVIGHIRPPTFLNTHENQFLNYCGQPCVRLNADTPLFGQQSWNRVFKAVDLILFGSLNAYAVG